MAHLRPVTRVLPVRAQGGGALLTKLSTLSLTQVIQLLTLYTQILPLIESFREQKGEEGT